MPWLEFKALLSGISPDTPLGRIVAIRSESDPDVLKHFSKEQKRIHTEWRKRRAGAISEEELYKALDDFKKAFISMAK